MDIVVALDGSKRRDLQFFAGDEQTLTLTVWLNDDHADDVSPLATVTDPRIVTSSWANVTIPVSAEFVVPDDCCGRLAYRLVAEVDGVTTTLTYGFMLTEAMEPRCGRWDYGFGWWGC